jgi:hypothetical protein
MKQTLQLLLSLTLMAAISPAETLQSIEFYIYSQTELDQIAFRNWQIKPNTGNGHSFLVPVKNHYLCITGPYVSQVPRELCFFETASGEKIASLRVNEDWQSTVLIFLDNHNYGKQSDALRYNIVPCSFNPQNQIAGQLTLLNLSGFPLIAKVNNQILDLKPNSERSCRPESQVRLQIALAGPRKQWIVGWKKSFFLAQHSAQALIIFPPSLSGSSQLDIRRIQLQASMPTKAIQ